MSKLTNLMKQEMKKKKKPRRVQARRKLTRNPAVGMLDAPVRKSLFEDPVFLFSIGTAIFRALEYYKPKDGKETKPDEIPNPKSIN